MRKSLKIILAIFISLISLVIALVITYHVITAGTKLIPEKLIDYNKTIYVYDEDGNKIENTSALTGEKSVKLENLNKYTIDAFISSEDKNFYKHNGLNYKRIFKAAYNNLTSLSFKEGASTISQQLIKNTHLSSDKTIKRKLKEIKLTKKLEKRYSKNQILEMYLNTIYFGHNCYGLQKASNYYFAKNAEDLTLEQSATIVGLLISPNNYSPFKQPEKCLARRNSVLKSMFDCKKITKTEYNEAVNTPLSAVENDSNEKYSDYLLAVFEELEELDTISYGNPDDLKIITYLNLKAQNAAESIDFNCDGQIFLRNRDGGIVAYRSTMGNSKRPIGSTAKPLFVYAPAIESGKLHMFTKINDEKVSFNGYSPENYDKKYHGYVTVEDSIKFSYNIPAVKVLNSLNLNDVDNYAEKLNMTLNKDDKNLALALGATKDGFTLKQICDAYSTFQRMGSFNKSYFIKEIQDKNGKTIYKKPNEQTNVFSSGTCSLINQALIETSKYGTAKKLKNLQLDVACKTGTCGNADGNTDAYSIAYTNDLCLGVWMGDKNNKRLNITGGKDCCTISEELLSNIYSGRQSEKIDVYSGTKTVEIDRDEYEYNQKIMLCDNVSPQLNRLSVKCHQNYVPKEKSVKFSKPAINKPKITVNNNNISIMLCQTKYYSYLIKRIKDNIETVVYDGNWQEQIIDSPKFGEYEYSVTPYYKSGEKIFYGSTYTFPKIRVTEENKNDEEIPDIVFKDWFNQ